MKACLALYSLLAMFPALALVVPKDASIVVGDLVRRSDVVGRWTDKRANNVHCSPWQKDSCAHQGLSCSESSYDMASAERGLTTRADSDCRCERYDEGSTASSDSSANASGGNGHYSSSSSSCSSSSSSSDHDGSDDQGSSASSGGDSSAHSGPDGTDTESHTWACSDAGKRQQCANKGLECNAQCQCVKVPAHPGHSTRPAPSSTKGDHHSSSQVSVPSASSVWMGTHSSSLHTTHEVSSSSHMPSKSVGHPWVPSSSVHHVASSAVHHPKPSSSGCQDAAKKAHCAKNGWGCDDLCRCMTNGHGDEYGHQGPGNGGHDGSTGGSWGYGSGTGSGATAGAGAGSSGAQGHSSGCGDQKKMSQCQQAGGWCSKLFPTSHPAPLTARRPMYLLNLRVDDLVRI